MTCDPDYCTGVLMSCKKKGLQRAGLVCLEHGFFCHPSHGREDIFLVRKEAAGNYTWRSKKGILVAGSPRSATSGVLLSRRHSIAGMRYIAKVKTVGRQDRNVKRPKKVTGELASVNSNRCPVLDTTDVFD